MKNISEKFNLVLGKGHKHYDFLDINLSKDNRLFIDPVLCQCGNDHYSIEAHKTLDSYMESVFTAIKYNNTNRQFYLFREAGEVKETYLGMSRISNYGKGSSQDILLPVFKSAMKLLDNIPDIALIPVVSYNFDKDRMSDLISRLCLNILYHFTLQQCEKNKISLSKEKYNIGTYWDYDSYTWKKLSGQVPEHNGKPILLTPKRWVCSSSLLNPQSFISVEWAAYRQTVHLENKSSLSQTMTHDGKIEYKKPSKNDVKKVDLKGHVHKDIIYDFVETDIGKQLLNNFFKRKYKGITNDYQHLQDYELDNKIYYLLENKDVV